MNELKNSQLLEKLLNDAKKMKIGKEGALTAERFFIASIDYVLSRAPIKENEEEKALVALLQNNIANIQDFRDYLIKFVASQEKVSINESLYIQNKLFELRHLTDESVNEVTPAMLVQSILKHPTGTIANYFNGQHGKSEDTEDLSDKLSEVLDRVFGEDESDDGETMSQDSGTKTEIAENDMKEKTPAEILLQLTEKTKHIREYLLQTVLGQNHAVNTFVSGCFQAELMAFTDKNRVRPRATFLFAGPPGVGKTYLAQKAAEALELPFRRFDMSEFGDSQALTKFAGTNSSYKDSKAGEVTSFVKNNPKSVLLFDEVEKAHISAINLFLQLLDAGKVRDLYDDKEISFTDTILIFTTNAGKQLYSDSSAGDYSVLSRKVILKALEKDTNPDTGVPYFPAAICSRFASGNVLMFNHIGAHDLRNIAKKEVLRHKANLEKELNIHIEIEESVFSALLFAEGGQADARTARSRGESFFYKELFEFLRLIDSSGSEGSVIDSICITIDLPKNDNEITSLFYSKGKFNIAVAADPGVFAGLKNTLKSADPIICMNETDLNEVIRQNDIQMVLVDYNYGKRNQHSEYMNAEDADSVGRDLFWRIRDNYPDLPVYLICGDNRQYSEEEKISFLNLGIRGFLELDGDGDPDTQIADICESLYQQRSINELTKANKVLTFETAQVFNKGKKHAEIRLFDFALETAVDSEDSNDILSNLSKPDIRFSQVIGAEDAKKELKFFVDYLKNPKRYMGSGLRPPKGILLYGPPGTGKTMLAKAMACEADVTFIAAEGNQFKIKWVGDGEKRVHELFAIARKYAPSILFVDEIDAIAQERRGGDGSSTAIEGVLTAFLAEMDGFKNDPSRPVFVLAATNFDVQPGTPKSLDAALMRRFDRKIYVDLPTKDERIKYLKMKTAGRPAFDITDAAIENLAIRSTGSSLAELENVLELALRDAIRTENLKADDSILENAFETYTSGEEKKWSPELLERTARHEAGHTLICWLSGEKPSYVTIVSRADHGGYMQHGDDEDKALYTKNELLAKIRTSLGGRAAELVYYGDEDGLSTGASSDLTNATSIAKRLVCSYGMDSEQGLASITTQELATGEVALKIRDSVNGILEREMENAIRLIVDNREKIDKLVDELIKKNHLAEKEIDLLLSR